MATVGKACSRRKQQSFALHEIALILLLEVTKFQTKYRWFSTKRAFPLIVLKAHYRIAMWLCFKQSSAIWKVTDLTAKRWIQAK